VTDTLGKDDTTLPFPARSAVPTTPEVPRPGIRSPAPIPGAAGVAGYELVRVIGQGGMGVVWEAVELRFDRRVALKVHAVDCTGARDDLFAEAFVAARIGDPGIVRVLDVGFTLDERPFYAMELVAGTDLAALLAEGKLPARRAIGIAADIARAVAAAHDHGVVHRDLKPRNVMIDPTGRARVLDFGIAVVPTAGDRYAGAGSPRYMAPEQVLGLPIVPQTDIFAIGIILYEMLLGEAPFQRESRDETLNAIVSVMPPRLRDRDPQIHPDVDQVVHRCLAKASNERFPSAHALFETLSAITEGRAVESDRTPTYAPRAVVRKPTDFPRREDAGKHFVWTWRLAAKPEALWPFVANTERFNKRVGVEPVKFTDALIEGTRLERLAEQRVLGFTIRWREFPFEWVKDREHSVFRLFQSGPLSALWNKVTLKPVESGGTELVHEIWLTPRDADGQVAASAEVEQKLAPAFDRFYRHLDALLAGQPDADPFEDPHTPTAEQSARVIAISNRLTGDGFPAKIVRKLGEYLLCAPDAIVMTLRPFELADQWRFDRAETFDVLIHAAHEGLLEPSWDVICPKCQIPHETHRELSGVRRVGACSACATTFERDLKDCVELVFAPHPSVRPIERVTYCSGSPALRPHIYAQQVLDPGEARTISVNLPRGHYRIAGAYAHRTWEFIASAVGFEPTLDVTGDGTAMSGRPDIARAGEIELSLTNTSDREETFRVEIPGLRAEGVSASMALTHPSFRSLFSEQLLAQGEHVRVSHLAFVFVGLREREALYERLGDGVACELLTRLDALVGEAARANEGTMVPSSLDLLVVAFPSSGRALRAAFAIRAAIDEKITEGPVAIAAHDGRCIALTREGTAEFFGETLQRGQALLADCPDGGLTLSAAFAANRAVAVQLHTMDVRVTVAKAAAGPYAGRRVTHVTKR
jgi:class 3 adenylate cyclase